MKTFEQWDTEDLVEKFGINKIQQHNLLNQWLSNSIELSNDFQKELKVLSQKIEAKFQFYNEEELKFFVISQIINLAEIEGESYRLFAERTFEATIEGELMRGRVEVLVALGQQKPRLPFFFIHEYKAKGRHSNDPLGQLLAAMLTAQELNQHKFPMLGCYVVGETWWFVVLEEKSYALSKPYYASNDDIFEIFKILKTSKQIIENNIKKFNLK
jgi:hypothetical protein